MIELPITVDGSEEVGRGIFDSKKAKHARAGNISPRVFRERDGIKELSVDRLSFGAHSELSEIHDKERPGQSFQRWAKLSVQDATKNGREIFARPIVPTNPYHAEIVLPESPELEFGEEQDQHALNLAMLSVWLPRDYGDSAFN
jgi:hypothetical protein